MITKNCVIKLRKLGKKYCDFEPLFHEFLRKIKILNIPVQNDP